jgi:hypothetical protein
MTFCVSNGSWTVGAPAPAGDGGGSTGRAAAGPLAEGGADVTVGAPKEAVVGAGGWPVLTADMSGPGVGCGAAPGSATICCPQWPQKVIPGLTWPPQFPQIFTAGSFAHWDKSN